MSRAAVRNASPSRKCPEREREAGPGRASWSRQVLNVPGLEHATQVLALLNLKPSSSRTV